MILSEKLNLLFIKVPKTGSSSFELALAPELEQSALITPLLNETFNREWRALFPDFEALWEKRPGRLAYSTYLAIRQLGLAEFFRRLQSDLKEKKGPEALGSDFWRFYSHISASDVQARIGRKKFLKLHKVAIVRHPYTRIISAYRYRLQKVDSYKLNPPSFEDWFQREKALFRPMTYFTHFKRQNSLDQIIKYENLDHDIDDLCNHIGIDVLGFKERFFNIKIHFYTTPTTEDLVGRYLKNSGIRRDVNGLYKGDFVAFNYRE